MKARLLAIAVALLVFFGACTSHRSTALIHPFYSNENVDAARNKLIVGHNFDGWSVESHTLASGDPRPRFDIVTMFGPYRDRGFAGRLRLTFFNDRLMSSEFCPEDGPRYMDSLRNQISGLPLAPKRQIVISRHTEFSYYIDPGGTYRVVWRDEQLSRESSDWVSHYS